MIKHFWRGVKILFFIVAYFSIMVGLALGIGLVGERYPSVMTIVSAILGAVIISIFLGWAFE